MKFTFILSIFLIACSGKALFKNGIVRFEKTPTRQVLKALERRYDVKVTYKTKKAIQCTFRGTIKEDTDIETVLEIMQFICPDLQIKYDTVKNEVIVLP